MTETPLDLAFAAMQADTDDDAARLRYYERLADSELCLLLAREAGPGSLTPQVYDLESGRFVMVFDGEERLAGFVGTIAPYAGLAGRVIAGLLAGKGIGLGINLQGASSLLIPADAVDWLDGMLAIRPDVVEAVPAEISPPQGLPDALLAALAAKLSQAVGQARAAFLVAVTYSDGRRGHLLAFAGAKPRAEPALAKAVGEALAFSGVEAGELDVGFWADDEAMLTALGKVALRFDMAPVAEQSDTPAMPGSDPAKPPILR